MDPEANLTEQRTIVRRIQAEADRARYPDQYVPSGRDAIRLAELVDAMDRWLCNGGFPPPVWTAFA